MGIGGAAAHDAATELGPVVAQDPGHVALQGDGNNKLGAVVAHDPAAQPVKVVAQDSTSELGGVAGQHNGMVDPQGANNTGFAGFVSLIPPPPRSPLFPYTTLFRSLSGDGNKKLGAVVAHDPGAKDGNII